MAKSPSEAEPEDNASSTEAQDAAPKAPNFIQNGLARLNLWRMRVENYLWSRDPRLVPTVAMFVGVAILLGLGTWQMMRSHEKNTLIREVTATFKGAPLDITENEPADNAAWEKLHYKPVKLRGVWLPVHEIKLFPRTLEGEMGSQLIMPLRLADNQVVLVNRGFIPQKIGMLPPTGIEEVVFGVAYLPEKSRPRGVPENVPSRGVWVWNDLTAMGHDVGVSNIAPVMIYENQVTDRDTYPIGGQLPMPLHNRHWHYAVTWYGLSLALLVIWLVASKPRPAPATPSLATPEGEPTDPVAIRNRYPEATD